MNEVRITPEAGRDLQSIKKYITEELKNPTAALSVVGRITKDLRILEMHPQTGISVEAKAGYHTDLRMLICGNYLASYRVDGNTLSVARILNGRQDYLDILFGHGGD